MYDVFTIKRSGHGWEVHVENGNKVTTTTVSTSEACIYLDKAAELMEDLDNSNWREIQRTMA